jgi:hypothetical protein
MSGGGCQNSNASNQDIAPTAKFGEQVGTGAIVRWKQSKRWRFYYFAITFQLVIRPGKTSLEQFRRSGLLDLSQFRVGLAR